MGNARARIRASAGRRFTAATALLGVVVGTLAAFTGTIAPAETAAAAPGSPGTPSAPVEVFRETFEVGQGATASRLAAYTGVAGQTHTADPFWLREDQCNGVLLQYEATVFPATSPAGGFCVDGDQNLVRNNSRRMVDVLGQVDAGVAGSTATATPVNASTAVSRTNSAVSAFSANLGGATGSIQFQTSPLALDATGTRFYTTSVDVAEVSCAYAGGANNSRLRLALKVGATEFPLTSGGPIRACTDARARYYTSPTLPGGWGTGGVFAAAGRFAAAESQLLTPAQLNDVQIVMRNEEAAAAGNDAAFDNVRILDATPQLDKSFSPTQVDVSGTSTLTLTVTNTSELTAKIGWAFTDALPTGLVVKNPANVGGTCAATVTATAGSGSIGVTAGRLDAGQVSCTITVDVTSTTAGMYQNCAANITDPVGIDLPGCAAVEFTARAFSCTADVVYGLNTTGAILAINTTTGASVQEGLFPSGASRAVNSLAMSADGRYAYAASQSDTKNVYRYDTATGSVTTLGTVPQASGSNLFMGAINPVDGLYYLGTAVGGQYVFYAFDTTTNTSLGERFRLTAPPSAALNGDLVFDSLGRAYVVMSAGGGVVSNNRLVVVETLPTDGSLAASRLLAYPGPSTAQFQGIAFGNDGYLYAQYSDAARRLVRIDPNSGTALATRTILNPNGTNNSLVSDLSSCTLNSTLALQKDVVGRYAAGDQFTVTITGNGAVSGNTGTTAGATTGVQTAASATAGPVVAVPGRTYTITETPAGTTDLARYQSTWECRDIETAAIIGSGTGTTGTVTIPAAPATGSHIACEFTNVPIPTWTIQKQALRGTEVLAPGATVHPGEEIAYRITVTNTSGAELRDAMLSDDLSDVLDDASFVAGSAQLVVNGGAPLTVPDPAGTILNAGPFTLPGGTVATLAYRVLVDADAWSTTLTNGVTGTAGEPGVPHLPDPCTTACTTTQVTPTPLQIQKVGEAGTGEVVPMNGSAWAIWDAPTGGTALVDPVPAATAGGTPVVGLFRDTTLTAGTYWLEETRALDGFELLSQRVPFTIAADGTVALNPGASSNVTLVDIDGTPTVRVEDVPAFDLPDAGGIGDGGIYLVGLVIALAGIVAAAHLEFRRRRKSAAHRTPARTGDR